MGERGPMYRLVITRGDTLDGYLRVFDGIKANGLKDLTGYTGRMHVRTEPDSPDVLLSLFVECGTFTPTDSRSGEPVECNVHFAATAYQTANLPSDMGLCVFDIELTDPFGHPWTVVRGYAVLEKDVSR